MRQDIIYLIYCSLLGTVLALQKTPRHIPGLERIQALQAEEKSHVEAPSHFKGSYPDIIQANLTQPLDHFDPENKVTFPQRYWYSLRHYRPKKKGEPTPIYVLDSGETDAEGRLPYLDHGILDILARETGGIGVVLEHRYYGASLPDRKDLGGEGETWGVDQMRWLNNKQALEDSARFVKEMQFPEADKNGANLTAPNSPVIYYGGSYPGARAAHMRVLYPDLIFGAIASSAVVAAIEEFPDYFYPITRGAQQDCVQAIQSSIGWIDSILAPEPWKGQAQANRDEYKAKQVMDIFGLAELQDPVDFVNLLSVPLGSFQALNWDPKVSSDAFADFCTALVNDTSGPVPPAPQMLSPHSPQLIQTPSQQHIFTGSWQETTPSPSTTIEVPQVVINYAQYIKKSFVDECSNYNATVEECFGTSDYSRFYNSTELDDEISWTFQFCSTWGYFMTAPPYPKKVEDTDTYKPSGPKLISSLMDLKYSSEVCRKGFPAGKFFTMPEHPNVNEVNDIGGFDMKKNRLAFINGQYDPWRPATTASEEHAFGGDRINSISQPSILIPNCWHHCDENGYDGGKVKEPPRVAKVHEQQVAFVKAWLKEWKV